jgi:hypothetical protein
MEILLNEELHEYTVDGVRKPSVTEILNTFVKVEFANVYVDTATGVTIPADVFEDAGDFGRAVHKAAKWIMEGGKISFPTVLDHAMSELVRWQYDNGIVPAYLETKIYSHRLDAAGTLDNMCEITQGRHANDVINLVDYKTAASAPTVGPQTWAYKQGYREMTGYRGIIKRWCLYLPKKEGEYKFVELTDSIGDEHYFKSMNYAYHWRRR